MDSTTFHVFVNSLSFRVPRVLYDFWNGTRFLFGKDLFPDKLKDFNGLALRATSFNFPPYTYQARPQVSSNDFNDKIFFKNLPKKKSNPVIIEPRIRERTEAGEAGSTSSWRLWPQTSTLLWTFSTHLTGSFGERIGTERSLVSSYHALCYSPAQ